MNAHEQRARTAKARAIASVVVQVSPQGVRPSVTASRMRATERTAACKIAGVNLGGYQTWQEIIRMLQDAERMSAALAGVTL